MKLGIVLNPSKSEREPLERALAAAHERIARRDPDASAPPIVHWFETKGDARRQSATDAAIAEGCDVVIAAGGDGTVRSVASELIGSEVDLGIVPLGTGNLLARNLEVPLGNPEAAFERILEGETRVIDTGIVRLTRPDGETEEEIFTVMVGFGIDAQMIVQTDDDLKSKAGWLAYVESLGRALDGADVVDVTIGTDRSETSSDSAHTILIGNCGSIQAGVTLLPDAVPDDGLLDMLILRADGVAAWLDTMHNMVWANGIMRLLRREEAATSSVSTAHHQAEEVSITLSSPVEFEIDGDEVGEVSAVSARVIPGSLRVR